MLLLLTQSQSSLGEEMDVYSEKTLTDPCTLVVCAPPADSLRGHDGRDEREGPRGEKGDQGRAGTMGLSLWEGVGTVIVTKPETGSSAREAL